MTLLEDGNISIFLQIKKKVHSKCILHCPHGRVKLVICDSTADALLLYLGNVALKGLGVILISKSSVLQILGGVLSNAYIRWVTGLKTVCSCSKQYVP